MILNFGGPSLRRQVFLTLFLIVGGAVGLSAYAFFAVETIGSQWMTPANIIAAGTAIFSLGMFRQQYNETKRRLEKLEDFNEKDLPRLYVRRDVLDAAGFSAAHLHKRETD